VTIWAELLWLALGAGVVLYALSGGPDLGAGVWSVLASGPRKQRQREALHHALAPIWEANHVWLIFVIVVTFSAFPRAFAHVSIALHIPIALSVLGLVLRGAAFAFHAYGIQSRRTREGWSRVFSIASIATPVLLGNVAGALGTGDIRVVGGQVTSGYLAGWTTSFAWLTGAFALALFATLSAVYLAAEAAEAGDRELEDDFRRRAIAAEVLTGGLSWLVIYHAAGDARQLFDNLLRSSWSWGVQAAAMGFALTTLHLLQSRHCRLARYTCAAQTALVVAGWGLAMDHHFILPDVGVVDAVTYAPALPVLAITLLVAAVILVPAFLYLLHVFKGAQRTGASWRSPGGQPSPPSRTDKS
jgi:cytochrome d ubiquinol oxidase subunit II